MNHGSNSYSRSLKQEDSPHSPRSHSSTSPTSSASQPNSPLQQFRSCAESQNLDFNRLPEIDNSYMPEECLDSSELDKYLHNESNSYQLYNQNYGKHQSDDESNNNQQKKRNFGEIYPHAVDGYDGSAGSSFARYHELQPSATVIKTERFSATTNTTVFTYQPPTTLPSNSTYYSNPGHQYLPSYQYFPQRGVLPSSTAGNYNIESNNPVETWPPYAI